MADSAAPPLRWDLFCRVIDNFGDIGTCWRLAADLASRGHTLRLWADDASALAWMAPSGHPGVGVRHWHEADTAEPADVVIEAFGCDPPPAFVLRMRRPAPPVWINLEYLSAEAAVERNHGLPSPQGSGPGAGLTKWFFYPGFSARSGGLIREPALAARQQRFDAAAWLSSHGAVRRAGERCVSLFCYDNPAVPALLAALAERPTLLLTAAGAATAQVQRALRAQHTAAGLRVLPLPLLAQVEFDHVLWSCELNLVRGEDSFVRAQWAGAPFVWQIYPQHDGVHAGKLNAFLDRLLAGADDTLAAALRTLWHRWNGLGDTAALDEGLQLPPASNWRRACGIWRDGLLRQADLSTQLVRFVAERR